jgi:4-hydroxythreonine-4-phosphate dehydrogenase
MAEEGPAPLAMTMGEPAGIGTEVALKAYAALSTGAPARIPVFFLIDDPVRIEKVVRHVGLDLPIATIERPEDARAVFARALPVLPLIDADTDALMAVEPGQPSPATAPAVMASIAMAVALALEGRAGAVVTLPIQKKALQDAGFPYPGHTEYLGALTASVPMGGGTARGPVMMLAAGDFRVVPVTVHLPLAAVPGTLTQESIVQTARVTAEALRRDFGIGAPRLAITGLNPHAGEGGMLGSEEIRVIGPAIEALQAEGIDAQGPFPADTLFHEEARAAYDVALCMYHDQALVPIKTLAFHEAVNVTLGLPVVRTSPDHGTALPIAGKGVARPDSTVGAILTASGMAAARAR